jgi:hypothetical protein
MIHVNKQKPTKILGSRLERNKMAHDDAIHTVTKEEKSSKKQEKVEEIPAEPLISHDVPDYSTKNKRVKKEMPQTDSELLND